MELDAVLLARLQFAFVVSFHILFPAFTIGLASYIAVLEALAFATGRDVYARLSRFWTRIFAVSFAMGVVSGIVMAYQFGTNWSRFADATAAVIGPLMGYEVLTAFFLEATFLGILLFGRARVPPALHLLAAAMVALGTLASAFWILSANSWMQTPAGYTLQDGLYRVTRWREAIFNPSFPYRFVHMVTAAYLTTAFVVVGTSAWYLRHRRFEDTARTAFNMGLGLIALLAPLQIVFGDLHGLNTLRHQPAKVAAIEAHWETGRGMPFVLFALPDQEREANRFAIEIPRLGSLILTHDWNGEIRGLKEWPRDERPPVAVVFFAFRLMVAAGLLMLLVGALSLYLRLRRRLYDSPAFLRLCQACLPLGFVGILAGWFTTEVGRQPWTVYGLLRTADSTS
ncbi:MAG TPA: cytochrome ubiquinol oxidase subunit I, partial [Moraxellaceae bacterium]|nr:cytochrome ubiquinol oxidase subunit I [Moraxellaceae bacterium]